MQLPALCHVLKNNLPAGMALRKMFAGLKVKLYENFVYPLSSPAVTAVGLFSNSPSLFCTLSTNIFYSQTPRKAFHFLALAGACIPLRCLGPYLIFLLAVLHGKVQLEKVRLK